MEKISEVFVGETGCETCSLADAAIENWATQIYGGLGGRLALGTLFHLENDELLDLKDENGGGQEDLGADDDADAAALATLMEGSSSPREERVAQKPSAVLEKARQIDSSVQEQVKRIVEEEALLRGAKEHDVSCSPGGKIGDNVVGPEDAPGFEDGEDAYYRQKFGNPITTKAAYDALPPITTKAAYDALPDFEKLKLEVMCIRSQCVDPAPSGTVGTVGEDRSGPPCWILLKLDPEFRYFALLKWTPVKFIAKSAAIIDSENVKKIRTQINRAIVSSML